MAKRISPQDAYQRSGNLFRAAYRPAPLQKAAGVFKDQMTAVSESLGHPEYVNLQAGESRTANAVVSFIDIRGFTKLSFVLESTELLRIVQALSQAALGVIHDGGGYVGEFTGDGVMAYFGDSNLSDAEAATAALETTSILFKTVDEIVNPELEADGIDKIRIAAGMEYGEVRWSRVGVGSASQIKPVANATFFAGKLSSGGLTNAWELKIGAELARWIPDEYKTKVPQYGPFTVKGQQVQRELYLADWRQIAKDSLFDQGKLEEKIRTRGGLLVGAGAVGSSTRTVQPARPNSPGPRPLKDQPFF